MKLRSQLFNYASLICVWYLQTVLPGAEEAHAQQLYVFLSRSVRPNVLQEKLSESCPEVEITVFGRIRDFKARMQLDPPDAILTVEPVLNQYQDYTIGLHGTESGSAYQKYVLLSVDEAIDPEELSNKTIGVVDFLGRREMESFVEGLLKSPVKLKRVTKFEDLLPLVTFKMVDAVFTSMQEAEELRSKSQLDFKVTEMPDIQIGLPVVAVRNGLSKEKIINAINRLERDDKILLGIEQWLR